MSIHPFFIILFVAIILFFMITVFPVYWTHRKSHTSSENEAKNEGKSLLDYSKLPKNN